MTYRYHRMDHWFLNHSNHHNHCIKLGLIKTSPTIYHVNRGALSDLVAMAGRDASYHLLQQQETDNECAHWRPYRLSPVTLETHTYTEREEKGKADEVTTNREERGEWISNRHTTGRPFDKPKCEVKKAAHCLTLTQVDAFKAPSPR